MSLLLSCEHATNHVPVGYRAQFALAAEALQSHRAWDPGALEVLRGFAEASGIESWLEGCVTRLLIDLNRSPENGDRWSEYSAPLPEAERDSLHQHYFEPYWQQLVQGVEKLIQIEGHALHYSFHSFTRRLGDRERDVDIGVLYDPTRARETALCERWIEALRQQFTKLRIAPNAPYAGTDDGLTTRLRRCYHEQVYSGIEIEICQDLGDFRGIGRQLWECQMTDIQESPSLPRDNVLDPLQ